MQIDATLTLLSCSSGFLAIPFPYPFTFFAACAEESADDTGHLKE